MLCAFMERECTKECMAAVEYDLTAHRYVHPERLAGKFYCTRIEGDRESLENIADAIKEGAFYNTDDGIKEGLQGVQEAVQNIAAMIDMHFDPLDIRVKNVDQKVPIKRRG